MSLLKISCWNIAGAQRVLLDGSKENKIIDHSELLCSDIILIRDKK